MSDERLMQYILLCKRNYVENSSQCWANCPRICSGFSLQPIAWKWVRSFSKAVSWRVTCFSSFPGMWIPTVFRSKLQEFSEITAAGFCASTLALLLCYLLCQNQTDIFETRSEPVTVLLKYSPLAFHCTQNNSLCT